MTGSANADAQPFGRLCSRQHCRYPIGDFHPAMRRPEHSRVGAAAMQNLAEKPLTTVDAATFGQVMRTETLRHLRDLGGFFDTRMIFPQPGHRRRIAGELLAERQWFAVPVNW